MTAKVHPPYILEIRPIDVREEATHCLKYVLAVLLVVGMCFCLKKANRLIPNRFSFPLVSTHYQERGRTRGYDASDIEQGDLEAGEGLLSNYEQQEEEELITASSLQHSPRRSPQRSPREEAGEEEEFGELQYAHTADTPQQKVADATL
ncbi:hypothetical protein BDF14DRAFT_1745268 [Spinellus fusiger]|nr:hypothetical protein BDF14DRAFT_1745268 [Spinellus fusiger]